MKIVMADHSDASIFFTGDVSKNAIDKVFSYVEKIVEDYDLGSEEASEFCNGKAANVENIKNLKRKLDMEEIDSISCSWPVNGNHVLNVRKVSGAMPSSLLDAYLDILHRDSHDKYETTFLFDSDPFAELPFMKDDGADGFAFDSFGKVLITRDATKKNITRMLGADCVEAASMLDLFPSKCEIEVIDQLLRDKHGDLIPTSSLKWARGMHENDVQPSDQPLSRDAKQMASRVNAELKKR